MLEDMRQWIQRHALWFWIAVVTILAVLALIVGTPIAQRVGQSADWYAGFGQWLGALGSLAAASVALLIATSDRREAARLRAAEAADHAEDLSRRAGLVRVRYGYFAEFQAFTGPVNQPGVSVENRRAEPIFDVEVCDFVLPGEGLLTSPTIRSLIDYPTASGNSWKGSVLGERVVAPTEGISIFIDELRDQPEDAELLLSVRYTDQHGCRWEVSTDGDVSRL